jgi:GntR family transcriptional repressor for pyruvate dehydrogenase complex
VRHGSGAHVSLPDPSTVAESMSLMLRLTASTDPFRDVYEVRSLLEVEVAGLAAKRATEAQLAELHEQLEVMGATTDREAAAEADVEFHAQLARATHNGLFLILLDSVADIMLELRRRALAVPGNKEQAIRDHRQILERVLARDVVGARAAMTAHLADGIHRIEGLDTPG